MEDWIGSYMEYTDGLPSPEIFRLWCGISCLAGAMERRLWVTTARRPIYPNLFVMLVAAPGIGKSAIHTTQELWKGVKDLRIAPNNMTKASMVDAIEGASRQLLVGAELFQFHSLQVANDEFGVLVPAYDTDILSFISILYDNPPSYREERRTNSRKIDIIQPQLNLLTGAQPGLLASLLPEEAWAQGFMSRFIMIYSATRVKVDLFSSADRAKSIRPDLIRYLNDIGKITGEFTFTDDARSSLIQWYGEDMPPIPEHSRLAHYTARRIMHFLKLCMVSSISRGPSLLIDSIDFKRAKHWLLAAEELMPDVFREMRGKSDTDVIQELHFYMWAEWARTKKALHESRLFNFLRQRVPSEKIIRIVEIAERSAIIRRDPSNPAMWVPRAKHDHGME